MPQLTYDGFINAASNAGLLGEFSPADLDTAKKYPEFGYSILGLKQDIHAATTPEAKLLANEAANRLRSSYGGYTGGKYGADYISDGKIPNQIDGVLDQINNFGSFTFDQERPTYENQYAKQQQALLDAILNREDFSWSKEEDPQWSSYKKSYLREGDRATADALGQAAAASGGRPSTAALTAATQAGDYYATQLNDIIPTLYQQAYDQYLNEYNMSLQDLNAVNTQEQLDYAKYLDQLGQFNTDRNFAFNSYLSDFDILQSQLGALQGQDNIGYNRRMDKVGLYREDQQLQREEALARQQLAQAQVDAILSAGGSPSADLVGASGYGSEYVQALEAAYRRQATQQAAGGGGRSSSSGGGKSKMTLTTAKQAANAGVFSDDVLAVLRENGYTDEMLEAIYGYEPNGGGSGGGSSFNQLYNRLSIILSEETPDNAQSLVDRLLTDDVWDSLSASEQNRIQQLLRNYGSVE
ncbi:hypothetical protein [Dysosmobacter welbionis]